MNGLVRKLTCGLALGILGALSPLRTNAASLQDVFANRETVTTASGSINGDNSTATVETGEPQTGGKPGGHSLWISWVAPADGVATFRTDGGSTFDTTLSAYFLNAPDTNVNQLHEAAHNDDSPGIEPYSLIQFGALAGHHYEIAVDGYFGATGAVHLSWSFINVSAPPPIVFSVPNDQSVTQGQSVSLSVDMQTSPLIQLKWHFNDFDLEEITTNLVIASLQPTNVGRYSLRITVNGSSSSRYFTDPFELQINSEGDTNTLARDKIFDAPSSPFIGDDGGGGGSPFPGFFPPPRGATGVIRGYNGAQIFDTTFATIDPTEPAHCGVTGGASYWLQYQPPANGTLTLDTIGSTFDTVLQAYTYNGTLNSYADLINLGCDNNSA
ncbi:MAG TPA: immunoglobulin domain-containing protein, partial [Candidatus Dormibacteraeota bacterium]|nr:immunoglobulin domain-containing protein [Candidatus Dormibacteraeota bacterium]